VNRSNLFQVTDADHGITLAAAIRKLFPATPWSKAKEWIAGRRVSVNGNLSLDPARRLNAGETVHVFEHAKKSPPTEDDVEVRYLDPHVVVVHKPAMVTTVRHPEERDWPKRRKQLQPTLDELLPRLIADLEPSRSSRGGDRRFPPVRAVHRLDRETSGLMVFARTPTAEAHLGKQFKAHTVERLYRAVIHGSIRSQRIESELVDDRGDGRRGSTTLRDVGKRAVTHVNFVESIDDYSIVECRLETGRTHQIRIHLAEAGHRLCGERVYNRPLFGAELPDLSEAPRVALHAAVLGFTHPVSERRLRFEAGLPADLRDFIARLRRRFPSR
jgi:23S rRNA pseudouridine1911/1915/1917 synthase